MSKYKRYAVIIILVSNAILISLLESFIPIPAPVPGVKLGLGNIITMVAIVFLGFKDVMIIVIIRCLVVAMLTRGFMVLAFSLTGGVLSAIVMWLLFKKMSAFMSIKGISIAGALTHTLAQVVVATYMIGVTVLYYFLPILLVSAVITGFITGSIGELTINKMRESNMFLAKTREKGDVQDDTETNDI